MEDTASPHAAPATVSRRRGLQDLVVLLRRLLREPLFLFLLGGLALYAYFSWQGEPLDPASRSINVRAEDRARLALNWQRMMQRAPSDAELDALTKTWLREEILYREALRLGLDRDDPVLRKRLATKMDFIAAAQAEMAQPSDQTLQEWLEKHGQRFTPDTKYSFDQLYFSSEVAAQGALQNAKQGSEGGGEHWRNVGEVLSLPQSVGLLTSGSIEARFGLQFTDELQQMDASNIGEWSGPIPSGFGWHLVRLRVVEPGALPPLIDVREKVQNDWRIKTSKHRKERAYQILRDEYDVTIER